MTLHLSDEAKSLPAYDISDAVNQQLKVSHQLVITAPPGAGKSTLLPLTILQFLPPDAGKILMLEPRRLAARQIAERMASLIGEQVGQTVGYAIRFENKTSQHTRIEVLTEGILTRRLISDASMDGVSTIIFDEFHERSIFADVALALTREAQQVLRPDLRIVIMSATIDATNICRLLSAPLLESNGRMFPVSIEHADECDASNCAEMAARATLSAHRETEGDILVFLPGEAEIRHAQELLSGHVGQSRIFPLFGMLPQKEQRAAIAPSRPGERKIVLATPIAETSLTIEGVRIVIDSGLCRQLVFDPQSGLSHLETVRISMDMADQRSGRAGRVAPGRCIRLWSLATEHRMAQNRTPEIETADLAPMMLDIAAWGERDASRLTWLTPPPAAHMSQAQDLLQMLGALDENNSLTPHGRDLSALPCHPRIAQMMLSASGNEQKALAADIAALLEEKDPLAKTEQSSDINIRIDALRRFRMRGKHDNSPWGRISKIAEQYRNIAHTEEDNTPFDSTTTGALLAAAYPERIASAREGRLGLFMLSSGELAQVPREDDMSAQDWIVAANVNAKKDNGRIFLCSPLNPKDLQHLLQERDNISWDMKRGSIVAQREYRIGRLILGSRPIKDGNKELIQKTICQAVETYGDRIVDINDAAQAIQQRVAIVKEWHPELALPDLSTATIAAQASQWLPLYMGKATTVAELRKIDMTQVLWNMLSYDQQNAVDRLAPSHIKVPTGSNIRLEYRTAAEAPVLRVRLQEVFGMSETPRIDDGRKPILMELLSPGYKPVQLTQDLANFWANTYFEVRKELKRRYPKHSWPDNPLEAEAVRGVKRGKN